MDRMNQKYSKDEKQAVWDLFQSGEPVFSIVSVTNIPRSTIYAWLKQMRNGQSIKKVSVKNFRLLENKEQRKFKNYLNQQFTVTYPNEV